MPHRCYARRRMEYVGRPDPSDPNVGTPRSSRFEELHHLPPRCTDLPRSAPTASKLEGYGHEVASAVEKEVDAEPVEAGCGRGSGDGGVRWLQERPFSGRVRAVRAHRSPLRGRSSRGLRLRKYVRNAEIAYADGHPVPPQAGNGLISRFRWRSRTSSPRWRHRCDAAQSRRPDPCTTSRIVDTAGGSPGRRSRRPVQHVRNTCSGRRDRNRILVRSR